MIAALETEITEEIGGLIGTARQFRKRQLGLGI
jgi:uncharacterized membrane protein YhiD involved in acid resistance